MQERPPVNGSMLKGLVEDELAAAERWVNWHGITSDNVRSFLVEPFPVRVDSDDLETLPRDMWIVLQENSQPTTGYVIVFDPQKWRWGLAEYHPKGSYMLDSVAPSFLAALIHM